MIHDFLRGLDRQVTEIYGSAVPEAVSKRLNQEIAYLKSMPENTLDVYLTILDAVSRCGHPVNSSTPYQPSLIAYLFGLVKTDPVKIVPPEMYLRYPLDINLEACSPSEACILKAKKSRFGEDHVVVHAHTENRLYVLFDGNAIIKRKARENRHGLLYDADIEKSDKAVEVILLRHPLLEVACAALEEILS